MTSTPDQSSSPPMPRWVKIFAAIAAILILLLVLVLISFPGKHGPGRHIHGAHSGTEQGSEPAT